MNSVYLIPANTKRGKLLLGLFREIDLLIFAVGLLTTFLLVAILPLDSTLMMVISVAPALICSLLVAPVPYYHNVMIIIIETYQFLTNRQKFIWKGWCYKNETTDEK